MHSDIVLGFDFGLKWIGVAVGNRIVNKATPLIQLKANQGQPNWQAVKKLITEWQPGLLIVGVPSKIDGGELPVTENAKQFASDLHDKTSLPVETVDERLTTMEARQQLFESHGAKGLSKDAVDSYAAKLITEQWLIDNH